uniref:Mitochondrial ribosomal protein S5 n=1 Tax=Oryzias latipes TaxID=8090 RepID=A0A3B3HC78_ORYLA
ASIRSQAAVGAVHFSNLVCRASSSSFSQRQSSIPLNPPTWQQTRHGSFFNKLTAEELWRGVLAESGAGARKGRGKRTKRKLRRDLNRGQIIGEGRGGFLWPGLNAPVLKDGSLQSMSRRGETEQQEVQAELGICSLTVRPEQQRGPPKDLLGPRRGCAAGVSQTGPQGPEAGEPTQGDGTRPRFTKGSESLCGAASRGVYRHLQPLAIAGNSAPYLQETHQVLADKKKLHVVEFQSNQGPLPIVVASPKDEVRSTPECEDEIPNTKLHWGDVRVAQGIKRSVWTGVKRTVW